MIWYTAVQKIGSARTAVYSNLTPIVAMVVAAVWLGERMARPAAARRGADPQWHCRDATQPRHDSPRLIERCARWCQRFASSSSTHLVHLPAGSLFGSGRRRVHLGAAPAVNRAGHRLPAARWAMIGGRGLVSHSGLPLPEQLVQSSVPLSLLRSVPVSCRFTRDPGNFTPELAVTRLSGRYDYCHRSPRSRKSSSNGPFDVRFTRERRRSFVLHGRYVWD